MQPLLRARDVARILNLRPATVYSLAHRGVLPFVRVAEGTRRSLIRFRHEDIEGFVKKHIVRQPANK